MCDSQVAHQRSSHFDPVTNTSIRPIAHPSSLLTKLLSGDGGLGGGVPVTGCQRNVPSPLRKRAVFLCPSRQRRRAWTACSHLVLPVHLHSWTEEPTVTAKRHNILLVVYHTDPDYTIRGSSLVLQPPLIVFLQPCRRRDA